MQYLPYYEEKQAIQYFVKYYKLKGELDSHRSAKIDDIKLFAKAMNEPTRQGYNSNCIISELEQLQ